jgi:hypothetical protein
VRKEQALKLAQRVTEITGIAAPIIIGSQSLYAFTDDVPELVRQSVECDFLLASAEAHAFRQVIEEIGFASDFQAQTGYYADALGLATVVLPAGWRERLASLTDDAGNLHAYCLEIYDACVSKLMAGRDKDFAFIVGLLEGGLIELETFLERVALVIEMPQKDALLPRLAKLEDELRRTHGGYNLRSLQQLQTRLRD